MIRQSIIRRASRKGTVHAQKSIPINGNRLPFDPGQTILQVAEANQIWIPTRCYLKGASPTGACRICVAAVAGYRSLVAACSTPATDGMEVLPESPRKDTPELLIESGNHNGAIGSGRETAWSALQMQAAAFDMPFGGVGPSGMGQYHGREGFLTFSKAKGVLFKSRFNSGRFIYPPYGGLVHRLIYRFFMN